MTAAVELLQHHLQIGAVEVQRFSEFEHRFVVGANSRINPPGRLRHPVDRTSDAPIGLIEVGDGAGDGKRRRLIDAREDFQL